MLAKIIERAARLKAGLPADGERDSPPNRPRPKNAPRRRRSQRRADAGLEASRTGSVFQGAFEKESVAATKRIPDRAPRIADHGSRVLLFRYEQDRLHPFQRRRAWRRSRVRRGAERHGIEEVNFTFEGHTDGRRRGMRMLNHEELLAGDVSLEYVSRLMNRRYTECRRFEGSSRRSGTRSTTARRSTSSARSRTTRSAAGPVGRRVREAL